MIKIILDLLKYSSNESELIAIANGKNKFPRNLKEFKNYVKLNY